MLKDLGLIFQLHVQVFTMGLLFPGSPSEINEVIVCCTSSNASPACRDYKRGS